MTTLTWPQVLAWRLSKQHLLQRARPTQMLDVASQIGGLHAQMMSAAELQVWTRVQGVTPAEIRGAIWSDHSLVKTWAMRGTLHLLPAKDLPLYVAGLRTREHWRSPAWQKYFVLTEAEIEAAIEGVRQALDGRCLTREQLAGEVAHITGKKHLREHLRSSWGSLLKPAAFLGYLCFGPSQGQAVTFVRPDQWIGAWKDMDSDEGLHELARRYLATYGPATRDDFARWFGIPPTEARPIWASLASELVDVKVDSWKAQALASTLDDMAAQSLPKHPSVRLVPNFDLYVNLNYPHRRLSILDEAFTERVYRKSAWVSPAVLVNGRIEGVWEYEKKRARTLVKVEMFAPATSEVEEQIEAEAIRLGDFFDAPVQLSFPAR